VAGPGLGRERVVYAFRVLRRVLRRTLTCQECGGTGLVTTTRRKPPAIEALADYVYEAA
jgi:hypothetical protein